MKTDIVKREKPIVIAAYIVFAVAALMNAVYVLYKENTVDYEWIVGYERAADYTRIAQLAVLFAAFALATALQTAVFVGGQAVGKKRVGLLLALSLGKGVAFFLAAFGIEYGDLIYNNPSP